jgi:predicted Zn-dependent peptidase
VARPKIAFPAQIPSKKVYVINRPGSVQTYLTLTNLALDRLNPDYIETLVMNRVLGSGSTSRLFRNIREEKGFTYGISSAFAASRATNYFSTSTSVRTEVTEPAVAEILKEFQDIRERPVPAEELADAKSAIAASFALGLESSAQVLSRWIDQRTYGLPEDYWDTYADKIQAVTAAGVQRVAKKYIPVDNVQIIAVGDAAKISEPLKKFGPVEVSEVGPDN